jgi:CRP-like cAMP-binding protein
MPEKFPPIDATDPTAAGILLSGQDYQAGESIFSLGDAADSVFYVQKGKVKLTVVNAGRKEAVVAILPAASFFGEGCLAGQPVRMSDAIAIQQSTIRRVTKQALAGLLHQNPEFAERFLTGLLTRNVRMESDLVDHLFNSSEKPREVSPAAGRPWPRVPADTAHRESQPGVHRRIDGYDLVARRLVDEPV